MHAWSAPLLGVRPTKPTHRRNNLNKSLLALCALCSVAPCASASLLPPLQVPGSISGQYFPQAQPTLEAYHGHFQGHTQRIGHHASPRLRIQKRAEQEEATVADDPPPSHLDLPEEPELIAEATIEVSSSSADAWSLENPSEIDPGWTFPQPFDSSLGTSFSSDTCPSFFTDFLQSEDFRSCHPLSLLLSTSSAMFSAQDNATTVLPYVLEKTCQVDADQCKETMANLADKMQKKHVCGKDLDDKNHIAQTALDGFLSYPMMLEAGCLKDDSTGHYCMAEAAASEESTSMYWWFLASGESMPEGTPAQCDSCTQRLMQTYSNYTGNDDMSISSSYATAAKIENAGCSDQFSLKVDSESSTSSARASWPVPSALVIVFSAVFLALLSAQ